jgi:hypothetical protein
MAAAIPEAVGTAAPAGETATAAATGSARAGGGARGARVYPAAPRRQKQGTEPRGGQQRERQHTMKRSRRGRGALKARLPGSHSYQPVVMAEFLVAVVVVAVSPLAKGGTQTAQAKGSPSPYDTNTLKQLVAIGGAYFVLALLAASRRAGRFAAWFGALILLGLGFTQLANGDLTALFKIFAPGAGSGQTPAQILGPGVTGPGVPADIQNAAQNALGPNPTSIFPTIEPGGTIVPAISLQDSGQVGSITVPAGQTGVITSGPGPGVNLA